MVALVAAALSCHGCNHVDTIARDIVLDGYEDSNYEALNNSLGAKVCVIGTLSIDTAGVYFPLQSLESGDLVNFGFSRINASLSHAPLASNEMRTGQVYRICGKLKDVTPFRKCSDNWCRWYELESAKIG